MKENNTSDINGFRIRINTLIPGKSTNFNLYIRINGQAIVYLRAGDNLTKSKIESLDGRD